ncbi:MAG: MFS transporter [Chromatiales bacterium]|jgi:MFS transporter, FSR family, fosmidomycin resistance protein|nr:MFS transporter [Chromatiales bacterium]
MSATIAAAPPVAKAPLFLIAGCHGALHWGLATFYALLPFIKDHLGLSYAETGLLASVVHITSFAVNVPSGVLVDVSGRRLACQLASLFLAGLALAGFGIAVDFWMVVVMTAMLAGMNTLWHPAAISFLSSHYEGNRGLALSFHTVGASIGEAAAPLVVTAAVTIVGWQMAAFVGAVPPLVAGVVLWLYFTSSGANASGVPAADSRRRGFDDYLSGMRQVLRQARVWQVCVLAGLRGTCQVGLRAFLPLFIVNAMGADPFWIGVVLLAFQGTGALTTPGAGAISDKYGRRQVLMVGLVCGGLLVMGMPSVSNPYLFTVVVAATGASLLSMRPVLQGWALDLTPKELGGSTISIVFAAQAAFAMTVPYLSGVAADTWGIAAAFYLFGGAALVAAVMTFFAEDSPRPAVSR